ncbi:MAG TPA: EAL domain-containing protein [Candidatus Obscuribacterales bacterium]
MSSKTILVVEDEVVIAMDLQAILIDLGYRVPEIITSGTAAIQKALEIQPDLVLMDIHLTDAIDGIDAAAQIIEQLAIPVIYLTAYADEDTLKRASQTQPFGYVLKPFEAKELKANIEIALYKHEMEQLLKENQQWLLAVLNSISEGVAATDAQGVIKFMNPIAEVLTGWSQAEAIGQPPDNIFHFRHELTGDPIENPITRAIREDQAVYLPDHTLLLSKTGQETPIADSASPIRHRRGASQGAVIVFRDITEQRLMQSQLEHNALHDDLTQLPNRALFFDRLQHAVDRAQRVPGFGFAVMLLDLNRFKVINDTFGHLVGDQLLVALAPRLMSQLRAADTVARLGGDEFVILLEDVHEPAIVSRTAERIIEAVQCPIQIQGHELFVTVSIGIVLSSIPYGCAIDLLRDADIAMYRAKAQGRGSYELFDSAMHHKAKQLMRLEQGLRQGIARQEFCVQYQPIVTLATREMVALEALVRWQKPGDGIVPPGQFIPLAEEVGLISVLDQWVQQVSCRQLAAWQTLIQTSDGVPRWPLAIAVNISNKQFAQDHFLDTFGQTLEANGLAGHHLKLEVTESAFIENLDQATKVFTQLKAWGVQICLDDFGTGYSSLSYLHRLPIDVVKIDRSFIQGMGTDPEKLEIVRANIGLCQTLGKAVIAEGIETAPQRDILLDLGCEYGQGFYFSPPVDAAVIQTLITTALPHPIRLG